MTNYLLRGGGTLPGETFDCTIHATGTLSNAAAAAALVDAWTAMWSGSPSGTNDIAQYMVAGVELTVCDAVTLDPTTGKYVSGEAEPVTLPGTATGASLPNQNSVLLSWLTAGRGRSQRGRMFLPCPVETVLTGEYLTGSVVDVYKAAAQAFLSSLQGAGLTPCIANKKPKDPPAGWAPILTPITGVKVGNVVRTQRRRTNKLPVVYT
jgi:hypothetical protein